MKTILIEAVSNGWIVRNHDPEFRYLEESTASVFNNLDDLMAALPELLCNSRLKEPEKELTAPVWKE